jgi:uncharacterized membrane protein HdeD (DUF308 family)
VTVVPAPGPGKTAFDAASERAQGRRAVSAAKRRREQLESRLSLAAQSAVGIAAGVLLLSLPTPSVRTIGVIIGVALLVIAAFGAVELRRAWPQADRAVRVGELAATGAIGVLVLLWPTISARALVYAIGVLSIVVGTIEAASLTDARDDRERLLGAVASVAALVLGVAMLGSGGSGLDLIVNLLGIYFVVTGSLRLGGAPLDPRRRHTLRRPWPEHRRRQYKRQTLAVVVGEISSHQAVPSEFLHAGMARIEAAEAERLRAQ